MQEIAMQAVTILHLRLETATMLDSMRLQFTKWEGLQMCARFGTQCWFDRVFCRSAASFCNKLHMHVAEHAIICMHYTSYLQSVSYL